MKNRRWNGRGRKGQNGGIGLLFTSRQTYSERIWDAAYRAALGQGKTKAQAERAADAAARDAKVNER